MKKFFKSIVAFLKNIYEGRDKFNLSTSRRKIRQLKIFIIIILAFLDLFLFYIVFTKPISPSYQPKNVFISNITSSQATISWTTKKPSETLVLLSQSKNFPILPQFSKKRFRDDKDLAFGNPAKLNLHHVSVSDLMPNKTYRFGIYSGIKKVRQVKFTTAPEVEKPTSKVISGKVLKSDKISPAPGVNIFFRALTSSSSSALISAFTDVKGEWEMDIGNLKSKDLKNEFPINKKVRQRIIIDATPLGRFQTASRSADLRRWPTVVLRKQN